MKIKMGFVTNSSSTSFCAWAITVDSCFDNLPESVKKMIYSEYAGYIIKYGDGSMSSYEEFLENPEDHEWVYHSIDAFEKVNLTCVSRDCDLYIGISPDEMDENKTIVESKNKTIQKLRDLGFDVDKLVYMLESWYD